MITEQQDPSWAVNLRIQGSFVMPFAASTASKILILGADLVNRLAEFKPEDIGAEFAKDGMFGELTPF
jgi:hypothetical protein